MKKNMLLIHGWDYLLYSNMTSSTSSWEEYKKLTDELKKEYNLYEINLPGFCGEPDGLKPYNVDDFATYVENYLSKNNIKIDIVFTYSFGGAVAIKWKINYKSNAKLFLVAPAIIRNFNNSKKFIKTPKFLDFIRNTLRDYYVIHVIKTNEMVNGSKFIRKSYQLIVREDLREDLNKIDSKDITMLFGTKDTDVAPYELIDSIKEEYKEKVHLIKNADHDNIVTDYVDDIIKILRNI